MTVTKWIHPELIFPDKWIYPILAALDEAGLDRSNLSGLSGSISIKLAMIPKIIHRINTECSELYETINNSATEEYIFEKPEKGCSFPINNSLKWQLLIDIDSLLFEIYSCSELIEKFFKKTYSINGGKINEKQIKEIIKGLHIKTNKPIDWFADLDTHRNDFIHSTAPCFAVDISNKNKFDLLVMKENLHKFDDEKKFMRLSQLAKIYNGFNIALDLIRNHLIELIKRN